MIEKNTPNTEMIEWFDNMFSSLKLFKTEFKFNNREIYYKTTDGIKLLMVSNNG